MRLIDADALKETIEFVVENNTEWLPSSVVRSVMLRLVDRMKTIDAEPVRRGKWIDEKCSECGQYVYHGDARNFCPACGAKMEVSE